LVCLVRTETKPNQNFLFYISWVHISDLFFWNPTFLKNRGTKMNQKTEWLGLVKGRHLGYPTRPIRSPRPKKSDLTWPMWRTCTNIIFNLQQLMGWIPIIVFYLKPDPTEKIWPKTKTLFKPKITRIDAWNRETHANLT
jgi:hypothetical protein